MNKHERGPSLLSNTEHPVALHTPQLEGHYRVQHKQPIHHITHTPDLTQLRQPLLWHVATQHSKPPPAPPVAAPASSLLPLPELLLLVLLLLVRHHHLPRLQLNVCATPKGDEGGQRLAALCLPDVGAAGKHKGGVLKQAPVLLRCSDRPGWPAVKGLVADHTLCCVGACLCV